MNSNDSRQNHPLCFHRQLSRYPRWPRTQSRRLIERLVIAHSFFFYTHTARFINVNLSFSALALVYCHVSRQQTTHPPTHFTLSSSSSKHGFLA